MNANNSCSCIFTNSWRALSLYLFSLILIRFYLVNGMVFSENSMKSLRHYTSFDSSQSFGFGGFKQFPFLILSMKQETKEKNMRKIHI